MSSLKLFLLGPPRLERDGRPLELQYRKNTALVAYLALTKGSHARESLVALLWPEREPGRGRADLRRNLSVLKKALGGQGLIIGRETIGWDPMAGLWLDVDQFHALLRDWQGHGHAQADACSDCLAALAEAIALYRGDFMAGFSLRDSLAFDDWQFLQGEVLRRELASALERLVRGHSAQGSYELAIRYARRWVTLDPLHEPAHRCLMHLYASLGQRAAAIRQYAECERVLDRELGASPEKETIQLYESIQDGHALPPLFIPPTEVLAASAIPQAPIRKHNLPVQLTPLVGRSALLAEIARYLQDPACRLLTLVGPGGSGKTRLALEAAAGQLDRYAHGVYFVPLVSLDVSEAIVPAVASALGFSFYAGNTDNAPERAQPRSSPKDQLLGYLRQKEMLILMDNMEHLSGGAGLVTEMLRAAPGIKVLATSRARLNVQSEQLFAIPGLTYPARASGERRQWVSAPAAGKLSAAAPRAAGEPADVYQYGAVQLFVQSARRVLPGFEMTENNLADVVEICRLVAGMPLGILLAAAWVGMLTAGEIASEIGKSLDFLEADLYDVPARQRSMRAVFDRAWTLLAARERAVMQALSVFRGGFTRQAAQRITGATFRELRTLIDTSLLQQSPGPGGRCDLHELLRQYAAEKLDVSPAARRAAQERHSAYYTAALQQWAVDLRGPRQQAALAEIEADSENVRIAWNWAVEHRQVEWLDRATEGLCRSFRRRGLYHEGETACRMATEKLGAIVVGRLGTRAKILAWQGVFDWLLGHTELAHQLLAQSLILLAEPESVGEEPDLGTDAPSVQTDTRPEKAFVLLQIARTRSDSDREVTRQLGEQSLALYRALGDSWGTARALSLLGHVSRLLGDYDRGRELSEESLAISRRLGDSNGIADCLLELGWSSVLQGQFEQGEHLIGESLAIRRESGSRAGVAEGLLRLGITLFWLGRFVEAHSLLTESVTVYDSLEESHSLAWSNVLLGLTRAHLGQYQAAHAPAKRGLAIYRALDEPAGVGHALLVLGHVALAVETNLEARQWLEECVAVYRAVDVQDELAWALADLAVAELRLGDSGRARGYLCEALRMSTTLSGFLPLWVTLPAVALLLASRGEAERAVELYALTTHCFPAANSRWFEDVFGEQIAAAVPLPPDLVRAAQKRGCARDPRAMAGELLAELE